MTDAHRSNAEAIASFFDSLAPAAPSEGGGHRPSVPTEAIVAALESILADERSMPGSMSKLLHAFWNAASDAEPELYSRLSGELIAELARSAWAALSEEGKTRVRADMRFLGEHFIADEASLSILREANAERNAAKLGAAARKKPFLSRLGRELESCTLAQQLTRVLDEAWTYGRMTDAHVHHIASSRRANADAVEAFRWLLLDARPDRKTVLDLVTDSEIAEALTAWADETSGRKANGAEPKWDLLERFSARLGMKVPGKTLKESRGSSDFSRKQDK